MLASLGKIAGGMAKKKVKKKGAEMAKKIVNKKEEPKQTAIVVREKSTALVPDPGGDLVNQDSSIVKPKGDSSPLDRIDSALLDIIDTLKKRRRLMLNQSRRDRVQSNKEKKDKREGLMEKMKAGGKKMLGTVKAAATGWWERVQRFLLMTMLGALVVAIKENWEAIKKQIDKVVNIVKGIWEFTSPVLIPLFKALTWITVQGFKMMAGIVTTDRKQIEKETDNLSKDLKDLEKTKEDIDGKFKEAEQGVRDLKGKKFGDLANESGKSDELSPDAEGQAQISEKDVENEVGKKVEGSDLESKLDDIKSKAESINLQNLESKKPDIEMKKYATGASPVPETGPAIVHKGEVIIPEPVVKKVGGSMKIENILNIMQSSTENNDTKTNIKSNMKNMMKIFSTNIKQNPSKIIGMMEGLSKELAPMGEQLPEIINEKIMKSKFGNVSTKIMEKLEKTSSILNDQERVEKTFSSNNIAKEMKSIISTLNEQTDYEDPSANTIVIPLPAPPQPPSGGGSGGETKVIGIGKDTLNRYMDTIIQGALY